jgi:hypothetical protein
MTPEVMVTTLGQNYQSSDKAFEFGKARQGSMSIKIKHFKTLEFSVFVRPALVFL